jgi:hypothetical protein
MQRILSKEFKRFTIFLNFFGEREINIGLRFHVSMHHCYMAIFLPFLTIYTGVTRHWVIEVSHLELPEGEMYPGRIIYHEEQITLK